MFMETNGDSPRGTIRVCDHHLGIRWRATGWSGNSRLYKNQSVNNQVMSDFRNLRNCRSQSFLLIHTVHWSTLKQSELIKTSSLCVHSVTISGLMPPSWKLTNRLGWSQTHGIHSKTRRTHEEPRRKTTSGLLPPRRILSGIECNSLTKSESVELTR